MEKRMTWKEIQENYPDKWVGLTDVEWEEPESPDIASAIVKYTDKTSDELYDMQFKGQGVYTVYTTPQTFPYGQVLIWGA